MARTILVADDSPTHQRRATGILTGEGLEVVTVSNGVAAIKKLAAMTPALILADISMPGRDGYEVCEHVKNSPALVNVPVLLIFSDQEPFDEVRAQRARADGKVKKPFVPEDLVAAVARYLLPEQVAAPPPPPPPPPEFSVVNEPVDLEPEMSTKPDSAEFSALPEGMEFGASSLDAMPPPAEAPPPFPEPPPPESGPPIDLQSRLDAAISPEPESAAVTEQPGASVEEAPPPPPVEAPPEEPVFVEEEAPTFTPELERPAERTMMFRMPVQLAQPILADDLAPTSPAAAEPAPPPAKDDRPATPFSATTLESYSLTDATAGQVRFAEAETEISKAPPGEEAAAETAAPAAPDESEAAAPVPGLDVELINWIVQSVVFRMAPPALRPEALDEIVRQLNDEIITALTQPPPEA